MARLRSQIATLKLGGSGRGRKYWPLAFTEQGVAMLSSVLNGERVVQVNGRTPSGHRGDTAVVGAVKTGVKTFEVTICDLKFRRRVCMRWKSRRSGR
ncbi:MAG: hypothetical protein HKL90_02780 [Elusimicrobia bacterium]|nr:hypothetical protein [Elusimicrobiota bacterium]